MSAAANTPTHDDLVEAVDQFASAAGRLLAVWEPMLVDTDDDPLTVSYPGDALPWSFDEVVAALWAWRDRLVDLDPAPYARVARWMAERFPADVDVFHVIMLPWGDARDGEGLLVSRIVIDTDADADGRPCLRLGVYDDTVDSDPLGIVDVFGFAACTTLVEDLTTLQPEGTDWAAWAAQYIADATVDGRIGSPS